VWVIPKYPQQELLSNFNDKYLATSVGMNWVFIKESGFLREDTESIPEDALKREDL